ncbi:MAG: hypothetical protein KAS66_09220 [Candidatus Omnitrophica bacterium]|nr:hypothetical protein [Candidatus Omnitrophota bacterium]
MSAIYVAITIDVEADCSPNWDRCDPLSYTSVTYGIPNLLQPVFNRFGAKPTYFLSPEIVESDESVKAILSLTGKYELGAHLHPEFIEPHVEMDRCSEGRSAKFACYDYSDEIEFEKIKNLTRSFERRIGRKPLCYRAGRYGADSNTIKALKQLGYLVDSSVTPHIDWAKQKGPNFKNYPQQPYFIDPDDFSKKDDTSGILEVPITIGGKRLPMLPDQWLFYSWLRPTHMSVCEQKRLIRQYIQKYNDQKCIVFCMMFHSMEVIPNASPYTRSQNGVKRLLSRMEVVLKFFQEMDTHFVGLGDVYDLYSDGK